MAVLVFLIYHETEDSSIQVHATSQPILASSVVVDGAISINCMIILVVTSLNGSLLEFRY